MADISTHLQKIMAAVYGEEVRGSIHDAIAAINKESSDAMNYAKDAQDSAAAKATAASNSAAAAAQSEQQAWWYNKYAGDAKTAAESAKAAAETASTAAQNAKTEAETAKNQAVSSVNGASNAASAAYASATAASQAAQTAKEYSGKPPKVDETTQNWLIWNAEKKKYEDSGISAVGPVGPAGRDGKNGEGSGDVLGQSFDLTIPKTGWSNKQITVRDERLIASASYKYFLAADEASRDEFLSCKIQPKDVITTGSIVFTGASVPTKALTVNVIRLELGQNS